MYELRACASRCVGVVFEPSVSARLEEGRNKRRACVGGVNEQKRKCNQGSCDLRGCQLDCVLLELALCSWQPRSK